MMRSIQPGQPGVPLGEYDVMIPVPYPYNIAEDGAVLDQDFWKGDPYRLVGFQKDADVHTIDVRVSEWMENEPDSVIGMYPVYFEKGAGVYTDTRHVESVAEYADYIGG